MGFFKNCSSNIKRKLNEIILLEIYLKENELIERNEPNEPIWDKKNAAAIQKMIIKEFTAISTSTLDQV